MKESTLIHFIVYCSTQLILMYTLYASLQIYKERFKNARIKKKKQPYR